MSQFAPTDPASPPAAESRLAAPLPFPLFKLGCILTAVVGVAGAAGYALYLGKGIGWDQMNYHHYDAYAWLSGRMDDHLAPAGLHNWLNPILYLPAYWMANHLPATAASAIYGGLAGLNFAVLFALAALSLRSSAAWQGGWPAPWLGAGIAVASAIVGLSDPFFHSGLGLDDADVFLSLLDIGSLCLLCWAAGQGLSAQTRDWAYAVAGLLLGAAAGLKWTHFVYAVGMTAALLILWRKLELRPRRFVCYAAGGVIGYLPAGGYWNWLLWSRYGNPFLPYWNNYFHSPWVIESHFRDMRYPPPTLETALRFPFQWFLGQHPTSEGPFRVATFAILSVLISAVLLAAVAKWIIRLAQQRLARQRRYATQAAHAEPERADRGHADSLWAPGRFVPSAPLWLALVFALCSYALWAGLFAIQRYLAPLCVLTGWLLWLCCDYLFANKRAKLAVFLALSAFSVYWSRGESQDWRVPMGRSWFGVNLPAEVQQAGTMFVMLGGGPMSYLVPYLPESSTTVRLFASTIPTDGAPTLLAQRAGAKLAAHAGPMRSISSEPLGAVDYAYLKRYGLTIDKTQCVQFRTDVSQFTSCAIMRQNTAQAP